MSDVDVTDEKVISDIKNLIKDCGHDPHSFEAQLVAQQIQTCLRFLSEGHDTGQIKLITRALKEMRYAYLIFNKYPGRQRISIFGSSRTPEDHPDYLTAEQFSKELCSHGWTCITGAANGIMKAGMAGMSLSDAFGLSIRLPFESGANPYIADDPKLIHFRYFFTRKLMFMSHSEAVAVFPGGVGTMDELFEMLTLMQTGKNNIVPVVLMEHDKGVYWKQWEEYVKGNLLGNGWVSPEDMHLYHVASSVDDAIEHIIKFYKRYHSSRYVKDEFVIRLKSPLTEEQLAILNRDFASIIKTGKIKMGKAFPEEHEFEDLPRLIFHYTRHHFGILRQLIDRINEF